MLLVCSSMHDLRKLFQCNSSDDGVKDSVGLLRLGSICEAGPLCVMPYVCLCRWRSEPCTSSTTRS